MRIEAPGCEFTLVPSSRFLKIVATGIRVFRNTHAPLRLIVPPLSGIVNDEFYAARHAKLCPPVLPRSA
jgi:hypothetical protein